MGGILRRVARMSADDDTTVYVSDPDPEKWTIDDYNRLYEQCPWFARGHTISPDEAAKLGAIVGIEYSEKFRRELGTTIQFTVERLLAGRADNFASLEKKIGWRRLDKSAEQIAGEDSTTRYAAIALRSTLDYFENEGAERQRQARRLVVKGKRHRGRQEDVVVGDFYTSITRIVHTFGGSTALPSHDLLCGDHDTALMNFAHDCAAPVVAIGEKVIEARCVAGLKLGPLHRFAVEHPDEARARLGDVRLTRRALIKRLRTALQLIDNKQASTPI
jgi:hypothetical protein